MRYGYMDQWNLFFFSKKEKKMIYQDQYLQCNDDECEWI